MNIGLFTDPTFQGLEYGLNSLALRQQVLAQNIANAQTPGYIAQDVSFQGQLAQILNGAASLSSLQDSGAVVQSPDLTTSLNGNTVNLESQMGQQNETSSLYDTFTQLMTDRLSILKTSIVG